MNTKFITIYHWAPIGSNLSYFHGFGVKKVQSTCLILDLIQHRIQKLCEGEANEHEIYKAAFANHHYLNLFLQEHHMVLPSPRFSLGRRLFYEKSASHFWILWLIYIAGLPDSDSDFKPNGYIVLC